MKPLAVAVVIGAAAMICVPNLSRTAAAQQPSAPNASSGYFVPVVVGAAAGATVGALVWPVVAPAGVAVATPAAMGWGWGAFMTTRAAVGAVIGAGLGYIAAR